MTLSDGISTWAHSKVRVLRVVLLGRSQRRSTTWRLLSIRLEWRVVTALTLIVFTYHFFALWGCHSYYFSLGSRISMLYTSLWRVHIALDSWGVYSIHNLRRLNSILHPRDTHGVTPTVLTWYDVGVVSVRRLVSWVDWAKCLGIGLTIQILQSLIGRLNRVTQTEILSLILPIWVLE